LDPEIAVQEVDVAASAIIFSPFVDARELLDPKVAVDGEIGSPNDNIIADRISEAECLCGSSRSRQKAAAKMFALLQSLAAYGLATPDAAMKVLGRALNIESAVHRRAAYVGTDRHYADDWLAGGQTNFPDPSTAEMVALRVLVYCRACGSRTVPFAARVAVYDLIDWRKFHGKVPPAIMTNALAMVCGVLDARSWEPRDESVACLLGTRYPSTFRDVVERDAINEVDHGRRLTEKAHLDRIDPYGRGDVDRTIRGWRAGEPYARLEAIEVRRLTEPKRTSRAIVDLAASAWARLRAAKPTRQLPNWRGTYWRIFADRWRGR
jgi:hypothetical protein